MSLTFTQSVLRRRAGRRLNRCLSDMVRWLL